MSACFRLFGAGLLATLAGCDGPQGTVELQTYLQTAQVHSGEAIEPLPEINPAHVFTYDALTLRNPFQAVPGDRKSVV